MPNRRKATKARNERQFFGLRRTGRPEPLLCARVSVDFGGMDSNRHQPHLRRTFRGAIRAQHGIREAALHYAALGIRQNIRDQRQATLRTSLGPAHRLLR